MIEYLELSLLLFISILVTVYRLNNEKSKIVGIKSGMYVKFKKDEINNDYIIDMIKEIRYEKNKRYFITKNKYLLKENEILEISFKKIKK